MIDIINNNKIILKIFLVVLSVLPNIGSAQQTLIADVMFENKLIGLGFDNIIDGQVETCSIDTITTLDISNTNISDLSGIEDFNNLKKLYCYQNNLTILDLSGNPYLTDLMCDYNQLTNLDLTNNIDLTTLMCGFNQLTSLDLTNQNMLIKLFCYNNNITYLDVTNNPYLNDMRCADNNLMELDLTYNTNLEVLSCFNNNLQKLDVSSNYNLSVLFCHNNDLKELNVKNGNNYNFSWSCGLSFHCQGNRNLNCISVDDPNWATLNWTLDSNQIDPQHYFTINCETTTGIEDYNLNKELIMVTDMLGRKTKIIKGIPLLFIYNDGTTEKKLIKQQ